MGMVDENGHETVTIKRDALVEILRKNREKHAAEYEIAAKEYREQAIDAYHAMAESARAGGAIQRELRLVQPQSHLRDYDSVIRMLELSVNENATISTSNFTAYVMDDWHWKDGFRMSTQGYVASAGAKHGNR